MNNTQTNLFLRSVDEAQERKLQEKFDQRVAHAVEKRFALIQASLLEQNQGQEETITVPHHRVEVHHNEENTVSQRSGAMHLEEKEDVTPGHEPKVIPDIIIATVAQQRVVMDLEEKGECTPGHEPQVKAVRALQEEFDTRVVHEVEKRVGVYQASLHTQGQEGQVV